MGASYSCIVTKEKVNIPAAVPHFYKGDVLTIPVDCHAWAVDSFLELFSDGKLSAVDEALEELESLEFGRDAKDPRSILYILKKTGLTHQRFLLLYYSEWADVPDDVSYAVFDKGSIISETKTTSMDGAGSVDAFSYIGVDWADMYRTDYFDEVREEYIQSLNRG